MAEERQPLPIWAPFRDSMVLKWQKFLYWVDVEWAKPFSWDSPRGFVWAVVPTMVAVLVLAFAIDIYMIFSHTSQERKDKAKEAEKTAELAASGGKKDD